MKIAFMFSGQGAEKLGMAKELYDNFDIVKETFKKASDSLGYDLSDVCFNDEQKIKDTEYVQPALVTTSTAILNILHKENIKPDYCLGLSLGEYSAFVASGALNFEETVKLVSLRGKFMKQSFIGLQCGMTAVMNTPIDVIADVIDKCKEFGIIEIANFNTPKQIVISGEIKALEKAEELFKENKVKFIRLGVNGAFHTSMLKDASEKLNAELNKLNINDINIPVVTNVNAELVTNKNEIVNILTEQIKSSVHFQQSIEKLIDEGVNVFIELGTGKTLSSFVKKISKDVTAMSIEDVKSLEKALQTLKEI